MLVLSRKLGEQITIGRGIVVTVVGVKKGRVKLGFSGPSEVPIHRQELAERLDGETPGLYCAECA